MRILSMMAVLLLLSVCSKAQTVSEEEALDRALQFINTRTASTAQGRKAPAKKTQMRAARLGIDGIYAFNREGGGFVIVASDDRAIPILGYSDSGTINWQQMPENMQAWLTNYSDAINALGEAQLRSGEQPKTARQPISPLLKTQWGQRIPYWNQCPPIPDGKALTGCVATAMAQVMNYHRWPVACDGIPRGQVPALRAWATVCSRKQPSEYSRLQEAALQTTTSRPRR